MSAQSEIATDQGGQLRNIFFPLQEALQETLVQQGSTAFYLIQLTQGFDNGRGTVCIGSMRWRCSVGDRFLRQTSVRGRSHHFAEIDMTGGRQHIQVKTFSLRIRLAFNSVVQVVENFNSDRVGILVIVTEERSTVQDRLTHHFRTGKIVRHRFQQLVHRETFVLKYMFL